MNDMGWPRAPGHHYACSGCSCCGAGSGPGRALVLQAVALIATGLVLIVAVITAPTPSAAEPLQVRWRPASEQERRDYERQRLADALDELRRH